MPAEPKVDGRRARRERSREAVVEALLDLLREGKGVPAAKDVADRAGVTERTLFNLYGDKVQLMMAAVVRFRQHAEETMPVVPTLGTLEERVEAFFGPFALFLEEYSAIRWAALTQTVAVPDMHRGVVLRRVRSCMAELLAPEGIDIDEDTELGAAVAAAVDPLTWRQLRIQQDLTIDAARDVVVLSVLALARARG